MSDDPRDLQATQNAARDQTHASLTDLAGILGRFRQALIDQHFTTDQAFELTRDYFENVLYPGVED